MNQPLIVKSSININAPACEVWDALVNPKQTKKYMYGCETVSDWKVGSELLWEGEEEGQKMVYVKGKIVEIKPNKFLAYTAVDTASNIDDHSDEHIVVTYELIEKDGQTILNVTQGDYSKVNEGERRYKEAYNNGEGWNTILVEIKKLVEATE